MGNKYEKLTARFVREIDKPGRYADGGNLFLQVTKTGAKSWVFRYQVGGREKMAGLGSLHLVGLQEAREKARELWNQLKAGGDPVAAREAARKAEAARAEKPTFSQIADQLIAQRAKGWKEGSKSEAAWRNTLTEYAATLMPMAPDEITTRHVVAVLLPIWERIPVTAEKLRQRIEAVLDLAESLELRSGANPARWDNHLDRQFADPAQVAPTEAHPSLPAARIPEFMDALRKEPGWSARALEFLILTGVRQGEMRPAKWDEIDRNSRLWTIPAARMKALKGKRPQPHKVPLSARAIELLDSLPREKGGFIFPGWKAGTCLSSGALTALIARMNDAAPADKRWVDPAANGRDAVPHGFRASFRTWARKAGFDFRLCEEALAHEIRTNVQKAYDREPDPEERRALMEAWGAYCSEGAAPAGGNVIKLHKGVA